MLKSSESTIDHASIEHPDPDTHDLIPSQDKWLQKVASRGEIKQKIAPE